MQADLSPTPTIRQRSVGLAERLVTASTDERLITFALGSCLGVTLWDPVAKVGGLLHLMLPDSTTSADKAQTHPFMFADTALPRFFKDAYAMGAEKTRLVVAVAGGARMGTPGEDTFQIGQRNVAAVRKIFWRNGVLIHAQETGGSIPRTMTLRIATGEVTLRSERDERVLVPGR